MNSRMPLSNSSIMYTQTHTATNLVERHVNIVTTAVPATDEVIVRLTQVRPERSIFITMNREIQNSATKARFTTTDFSSQINDRVFCQNTLNE